MSSDTYNGVGDGMRTDADTLSSPPTMERRQQRQRRFRFSLFFYSVLLVILLFIVVRYVAIPRVNTDTYFQYLNQLRVDISNTELGQLLNANAIGNLPHVHIVTNNSEINDITRCQSGAVYLGPITETTDYRIPCFNTCGSQGRVLSVAPGQLVIHQQTVLATGVWCVLNAPDCNLQLNYLYMGINGVVCRSRFPNMFGNSDAAASRDNNIIVACQNEMFPHTNSQLMDFTTGRPITVNAIQMSSEDEVLNTDGITKRFQCRFGEDFMGNAYLPHPLNRFHPIRNPCNYSIVRSSTDVRPVVAADGKSWHCDCGSFDVTRVRNMDPNNPKTTCSSCFASTVPLQDPSSLGVSGATPYTEAFTQQVPVLCFTVNSQFTDVKNIEPCPSSQFLANGNRCVTATFRVAHHATDDVPMPFSYVRESYIADSIDVFEGLQNIETLNSA